MSRKRFFEFKIRRCFYRHCTRVHPLHGRGHNIYLSYHLPPHRNEEEPQISTCQNLEWHPPKPLHANHIWLNGGSKGTQHAALTNYFLLSVAQHQNVKYSSLPGHLLTRVHLLTPRQSLGKLYDIHNGNMSRQNCPTVPRNDSIKEQQQ